MSTQLRPMTLGEILDRTAELYRNHFLLFAGTSSIFSGAMLLMQMLHVGVLALIGYPHVPSHLEWTYAVALVAELLAIVLLGGLSIAAFNHAVAWVYLGQSASVRGAVRSIFSRLGRYLWLMAVIAFRAWAPLAILYVAFFAILFTMLPSGFLFNPQVAQHAPPQDPTSLIVAGLAMLILAPLMLGALVYGVLMALRYSLAMPACVVEGLPARQAIKRSIELSKGSRGRIFVLGLLVTAIQMLLGLLLGFPTIVFAVRHLGEQLPLGWLAVQQIVDFFTATFIGPIYSAGLTLFYYDQRIRREGFDIEWMMQAAGMTPQTETAAPKQN